MEPIIKSGHGEGFPSRIERRFEGLEGDHVAWWGRQPACEACGQGGSGIEDGDQGFEISLLHAVAVAHIPGQEKHVLQSSVALDTSHDLRDACKATVLLAPPPIADFLGKVIGPLCLDPPVVLIDGPARVTWLAPGVDLMEREDAITVWANEYLAELIELLV